METLLKFPLRLAIIRPEDGVSSNAWKLWTSPAGDIYIACRDNFGGFKVSLHKSGRWRAGFTEQGRPEFVSDTANRAWEVWDAQSFNEDGFIRAFELHFLRNELGVRPDQRLSKKWKDVEYFDAAPPGKVVTVSVLISANDVPILHKSEPSFLLASSMIAPNRWAIVNIHLDPDNNAVSNVKQIRESLAVRSAEFRNKFPYVYALGHGPGETRFIVPAYAHEDLVGR